MKIPIHSFKQRIVYGDNSKPPRWSLNSIAGWLGSGILDAKGREIYEGDKVRDEKGEYYVVVVDGSEFVVENDDKCISLDMYNTNLEIVGHVED